MQSSATDYSGFHDSTAVKRVGSVARAHLDLSLPESDGGWVRTPARTPAGSLTLKALKGHGVELFLLKTLDILGEYSSTR